MELANKTNTSPSDQTAFTATATPASPEAFSIAAGLPGNSPSFEARDTWTSSSPAVGGKGRHRRFERCDSAELPDMQNSQLSPTESKTAPPEAPQTVCSRMRQRRERMRRYTQQTLDLGGTQRPQTGVLTTSVGVVSPVLPIRLLEIANSRLQETGLSPFADVNYTFESHYEVLEQLGQVTSLAKNRAPLGSSRSVLRSAQGRHVLSRSSGTTTPKCSGR